MRIIQDPGEMQKEALSLREKGKRIGFVPTMGYFHEGHLSLMRCAREKCDVLVVSNFVNPTQFAPTEDLDSYPRDFQRDCHMAESIPVDIMFAPSRDDMYPPDYRTYVHVEDWGKKLCGMSRPEHFRGVTTIVTRLFNVVQPHLAVFGWKDAQQFLILKRMVRDLDIPVEMIGGEIVREKDGLAMSSRNRYLSPEERKEAVVLSRSLKMARKMIREEGVGDAGKIIAAIRGEIEKTKHGEIDYVVVASMSSLEEIGEIDPGNTLIALAVKFGGARLIDNIRC